MKMALFAAAFALTGAAFAQDTQPAPAPPAESAMPGTPQAAPTPVPADNSAPEPDNQGTPVISNPAEAPAGFNQPPQVGGTGVPADARPTPQPATQNYPRCSRTVTDNCVQRERGTPR